MKLENEYIMIMKQINNLFPLSRETLILRSFGEVVRRIMYKTYISFPPFLPANKISHLG
jgi:hypothetical protein